MFLTTNRVQAFDPAFESRIHLIIDYPIIGPASRLPIWRIFVRPTGEKSVGNCNGTGSSSNSDSGIGGFSEAEFT